MQVRNYEILLPLHNIYRNVANEQEEITDQNLLNIRAEYQVLYLDVFLWANTYWKWIIKTPTQYLGVDY